jgi:hypothetical protein
MTTAKNPITGDNIVSKKSTEAFRNNFDAIFRKKPAGEEGGSAALSGVAEGSYTSVTTDTQDDHARHSANP